MDKTDIIANYLNDVINGIKTLTHVYQSALNMDYPARSWSDDDVFNAFNGSALTDDPVYENKKDLSIYLRGVLDGEHRMSQNVLGNLARYTEMDLSDDELDKYHARIKMFWADIAGKELIRLLDALDAENVDDAMAMIEPDRWVGNRCLVWDSLTKEQRLLIQSAKNANGATVGTWEINRMRQAEELVDAGYLSHGQVSGRSQYYHITLEGRKLLNTVEKKTRKDDVDTQ